MQEYIFYAILIFLPLGCLMAYFLNKEGLEKKNIAFVTIAAFIAVILFPICAARIGTVLTGLLFIIIIALFSWHILSSGFDLNKVRSCHTKQAGNNSGDIPIKEEKSDLTEEVQPLLNQDDSIEQNISGETDQKKEENNSQVIPEHSKSAVADKIIEPIHFLRAETNEKCSEPVSGSEDETSEIQLNQECEMADNSLDLDQLTHESDFIADEGSYTANTQPEPLNLLIDTGGVAINSPQDMFALSGNEQAEMNEQRELMEPAPVEALESVSREIIEPNDLRGSLPTEPDEIIEFSPIEQSEAIESTEAIEQVEPVRLLESNQNETMTQNPENGELELRVNGLIDQGFTHKAGGNTKEAVSSFQYALSLTDSVELKYLLSEELISHYEILGQYTEAINIMKNIIGSGIVPTAGINQAQQKLEYLEYTVSELERLGLGEVPASEIPRLIKLQVGQLQDKRREKEK